MKGKVKQQQFFSVALVLLALNAGCTKVTSGRESITEPLDVVVASERKEIIARQVLAVQLAAHQEFEDRTNFAPTEVIPASLYLTDAPYLEWRCISAFLVCEKGVVEEESISLSPDDKRQAFDFRFIKTPRPAGAYQIRFVEITRSTGKPVLLARLFLNVE